MKKRIWLITGISSGLGKALAAEVIDRGDVLAGTFRNGEQVTAYNESSPENAYAFYMDLDDPVSIREGVNSVVRKFGGIDVLVNNAGYGLIGAVEESDESEVRALFETNFFGTFRLTQAVLPLMREQRQGHIFQISSQSGFKGFPGFGIYCASKFALEGMSESLAQEIMPLGIRLTIVEPGPFRTDFAGSGLKEATLELPDYESTAGEFRRRIRGVNGKQEGDPVKAAVQIYAHSLKDDPSLRLPLGAIAIKTIESKLEEVKADLELNRKTAEKAVY